MPPRKDDGGRLYVAKTNFAAAIDGVPVVVLPGDLAREGHPILIGRGQLFEPFVPKVRFDTAKAEQVA